MELTNELCNVQIEVDNQYTIQSMDNRHYDYVINADNLTHNDFYKTLSIHIDLFHSEMDIALVGDFYSYDDCAFLDDNILTIMQNNTISQINIENAELLLHKKFECYGCNFGIFQIFNGYIVYGEMEILRLDLEFNKVWGFYGRDIFVTQSKKKPFELCENRIKLYDWEDNYYELDLDGNLICDIPNTSN